MKKILFLIEALLLVVVLHGQVVKQNGKLRVVGTQLVNEKGKSIALHGMSFGWSCFHPRFYTAGAVRELVNEWNSTVVRASLGVEPAKGFGYTIEVDKNSCGCSNKRRCIYYC
jgi:endoglucanase